MINDICTTVVSLFESMRAPNGALRDFKSTHSGHATPDTALQPAATVAWDGWMDIRRHGNAALVECRLVVTGYSSHLLPKREDGATAHQALLCRVDGSKLIGLSSAIAKMTFEGLTVAGQPFDVEAQGETKTFAARSKTGNGWSYMSIQKLVFRTLMNRSQIID
mgnify:CR=1 FL=1